MRPTKAKAQSIGGILELVGFRCVMGRKNAYDYRKNRRKSLRKKKKRFIIQKYFDRYRLTPLVQSSGSHGMTVSLSGRILTELDWSLIQMKALATQ
uniref:Transposase n=1 Tax=Echinococcus granulosus TaxID=6210 RepID=A0A068W836_ECHGR|nr:hypothetical protein EgrG_000801000 [Echinococcus granulosus]